MWIGWDRRGTILKRPGYGSLRGLILAVTIGTIGFTLVAPSVAFAEFVRPFLHQIAGTGSGDSIVPFENPGGVVIDPNGNLWVGDMLKVKAGEPTQYVFDEFNSSYEFVKTIELKGNQHTFTLGGSETEIGNTSPGSISINDLTGDFYVTGSGTSNGYPPFVEAFESSGAALSTPVPWNERKFGGSAHVAVDNSCSLQKPVLVGAACDDFDPSNGFIYVAHGKLDPGGVFGDGLPAGIEKLNASGECVPFEEKPGQPTKIGYVEGCEIIGTPDDTPNSESFDDNSPGGIAVGLEGTIYAIRQTGFTAEVDEYSSSGLFLGAITGEGAPSLGESDDGKFGAVLEGVAVDPVTDHVLISLSSKPGDQTVGAIDEFDSSGKFLKQITETSEGALLRRPEEMTFNSSGDLYVDDNTQSSAASSEQEHVVDVFGSGKFLPSVKLEEVGMRTSSESMVNGLVNPEGLPLGVCVFEYVNEEEFNHNVEAHKGEEREGFSELSSGGKAECEPSADEISKESNLGVFYSVQAKLTGLEEGTTYRYRLTATNSGVGGGSEETKSFAFTTPGLPRVEASSAFAGNISSEFADLHARIDPDGAATSYHFEYDTSAYGNGEGPHGVSVPVPYAGIGSGGPTGSSYASVEQPVGGLVPDTTYYFRVVATNDIETVYGPDETFKTVAATVPGLPDGRAYELLTPPNKGSSPDIFTAPESKAGEFFNNDVGYPSEDGDGFLLETEKASFGAFPATGHNVYIFHRDAEKKEWTYTSLASPSLGPQGVFAQVFDPSDLSEVGLDDEVGSLPGPDGYRLMALVGPPGGPYTTLHIDAARYSLSSEDTEATKIVGAADNLSHVIIESLNHMLAPGAEAQDPDSSALYEWAGNYESAGSEPRPELKLVNVNSKGELLDRCGATLGLTTQMSGGAHNAVSEDGSRVFFTVPDPYAPYGSQECWDGAVRNGPVNAPQLYTRSNGYTIEVSEAEKGVSDPSGIHPALYVGAAENGSKVFFVTETELTKEAVELELHDPELYECEIVVEADSQRCKLTRISAGMVGESAADVYTVPAVSADGSAVYFTAFGALAPGASVLTPEKLMSGGEVEAGDPVNLYRYETRAGSAGTLVYVGRVSTRDYPNSDISGWWRNGAEEYLPSQVALSPDASWYTTPDGRYLLFASENEVSPPYSTVAASLTDCPKLDRGKEEEYSGFCTEVYRYDSKSGMPPVCLSCDPSGERPISNAFFAHSASLESPAAGPVRAMSDDGSYAFFDSADPLVTQVSNGTLDVYEWHENLTSHGDSLSLIGSGSDDAPSFFLGTDPQGENVFFGTHAKLVPQDTDSAGDLYDARLCTEADPCFKPPPSGTGQCESSACENQAPTPIDATPVSLTFSGPGNVSLSSGPVVKQRSLTQAQRLANALKACRKKRKGQRGKCEAQARKRYGTKPKAKKKAKKSVVVRHVEVGGRAGK
jgi:hypothetical protein